MICLHHHLQIYILSTVLKRYEYVLTQLLHYKQSFLTSKLITKLKLRASSNNNWLMCWTMLIWSSVHQRLKKWYLMVLSMVRYGSRVKWSNTGKGVVPCPALPLDVIAIEKGVIRLPSITVASFTFTYEH